MMMLVLFIAGAAMLAAVSAIAWRDSVLLTNPRNYRHPLPASFQYPATPLSAYGLPFEEITIEGPRGSTIRGWLIPASNGARDVAVVALHGRGGDRRSQLPHAPMLHSAGVAVALIDLRENGLSDGNGAGTGLGMREADDALATAAELRRRGYRSVVLFGCSLGASAAVIAAARDPNIAGVLAESPLESMSAYVRDDTATRLRRRGMRANWVASTWAELVVTITRARVSLTHLENPIDVVNLIAPRPVLIIHGGRDETVPLAHAQRLATRAGASARLLTIPEAGHCNGFEAAPTVYAEQVRQLLELTTSS